PCSHTGEPLALTNGVGELFSHFFPEQRFIVKRLQLGRCAVLEEIDHPFGLGRKVRDGFHHRFFIGSKPSRKQIRNQQRSQSSPSQAETYSRQELPPIQVEPVFQFFFFHHVLVMVSSKLYKATTTCIMAAISGVFFSSIGNSPTESTFTASSGWESNFCNSSS